ncbi:hypothetical protein N7G274_010019 [Stereocaulon virgatum]|uniref:Uncharacterized protein n=1 Tax=Stereocaulon virgatum TaxID=373712 RepID=A0ABR3ZVZ6_9LECA
MCWDGTDCSTLFDKTRHHVPRNYSSTEISVHRLNNVYSYLWLAGSGIEASLLTEQTISGRSFVLTPRADMHMVFHGKKSCIEPLAEILLCHTAWTIYDDLPLSRRRVVRQCVRLTSFLPRAHMHGVRLSNGEV